MADIKPELGYQGTRGHRRWRYVRSSFLLFCILSILQLVNQSHASYFNPKLLPLDSQEAEGGSSGEGGRCHYRREGQWKVPTYKYQLLWVLSVTFLTFHASI